MSRLRIPAASNSASRRGWEGGDIGGWQGHGTRDVIFRKITNRNQTDTNEMATGETKYQTDFILPKNTNIKPKFKKIVLNMPIKYQENTKNFGTEVPNTDLLLVFSWYTKF